MSTREAYNLTHVTRAFEEFINRRNPGAAGEYVSSSYVGHFPGLPPVQGIPAFQQFIGMWLQAFPDAHVTIEDAIADGDKVAVRTTFCGTHQGELMGVPPTGRQVTVTSLNLFRIEDGRAVEQWVNSDDLGMMQQLGVIPAPAAG